MFNKKTKTCCFLLLQICFMTARVKSIPESELSDDQPSDLQGRSNDDSVSVFVKQPNANLNDLEGFPLGIFDPKLLDAFSRRDFLENSKEASVFREDFVNQHPTHLEKNKIPSQHLEFVQNDADRGKHLQKSHFQQIDANDKRNRNNFGQIINLGFTDSATSFQSANENPAESHSPLFGHNLKEFKLFEQENSLPQHEFNSDQILSPTLREITDPSNFPAPTSYHNQNQITGGANSNIEITSTLNNGARTTQPNLFDFSFQNSQKVENEKPLQQDRPKNVETRVIPGVLEAKVVPGVLMRQFVDVHTAENDPFLNSINSPNNLNLQAPSTRLLIPARDLNALPVYPPVSFNSVPAKRDSNSNNFVRDFDNRSQQLRHTDQGQTFSSNNVQITGGFTPSFFGRGLSTPSDLKRSISNGRSLNDNLLAPTVSQGQFVPGVLERGFIPSNFLLLSSF